MNMNITEIMESLPHRYPFLLIDKVIDGDEKTFIRVQKNVSVNEPHFTGHFPGKPVLPGVLVIESMAQATGLLSHQIMGGSAPEGSIFMLAGVDNARFKRQVIPGDIMIIQADLKKQSRNVMKFDVTAKVDAAVACTAEIMGAFAV